MNSTIPSSSAIKRNFVTALKKKSHQARLNGIFNFKMSILQGLEVTFAASEIVGNTEGNPSTTATKSFTKCEAFLFSGTSQTSFSL